jgi:hypothetical protein
MPQMLWGAIALRAGSGGGGHCNIVETETTPPIFSSGPQAV